MNAPDATPPGAVAWDDNRFLVGEEKQGPFDLIELAAQLRTSAIHAQTLVFRFGENEGVPLESLPEYAELRDMPVETIARHLEEKERVPAADRPRFSSSVQAVMAAGLVFAGLALAIVLQPWRTVPAAAPSQPAPPVDPWQSRSENGFTVDSPAPLHKIVSDISPKLLSYRGFSVEMVMGFGVDMQYVPGNVAPEDVKDAVNSLRDQILDGLDAKFISETAFIVQGRNYRKTVLFSHDNHGKKMPGGACIICGPDRIAMAWAVGRGTKEGSEQIQRYLDSFQLR